MHMSLQWFCIVSISAAIVLTVGCNKSSNDSDGGDAVVNQSRQYQIPDALTGCSTGLHYFNTDQEYCKGLLDEALNNYCSSSARKGIFEKDCQAYSSLKLAALSSTTATPTPTPTATQQIEMTYVYADSSCTTGEVKFTTKDDFCAKIQNETLNNNCAKEQRSAQYHVTCLSENYYYRFYGENCTTEKYFKTEQELCAGLNNNALNNNCANEARIYQYHMMCQKETYSYRFTGTNCTAEQYFKTQAEMCAGLMNEALNNNCARDQRIIFRMYNCKGL